MSGAYKEECADEVSAKSIRARAAEWHDRREREDWSAEHQAALDAWLAASPAHMIAYLRVDSAWHRADRLSALRATPPENAPVPKWRVVSGLARYIAGFAVIALVGAAAASYFSRAGEQSYATAIGGHKTIALADGSQIELNTDTALRVRNNGGQREVWLDRGEAYFQVKHDAAHSFTVMVAGHRVTDLGTKFTIRRDMDHVQVAVMQGRVRVEGESDRGERPALLAQGDVLVANGNAISVAREKPSVLMAELGWRRGMLMFDNTSLAEAANEFNRYNHAKLIVADDAAARMPIDGKFRTNDLAGFTLLVQSVLGLRVASQGGDTIISR